MVCLVLSTFGIVIKLLGLQCNLCAELQTADGIAARWLGVALRQLWSFFLWTSDWYDWAVCLVWLSLDKTSWWSLLDVTCRCGWGLWARVTWYMENYDGQQQLIAADNRLSVYLTTWLAVETLVTSCSLLYFPIGHWLNERVPTGRSQSKGLLT